jgi:hypothetical protein
MLKSFSFFEVESGQEDRVLKGFRKAVYEDQQILVEKSLPKPELSNMKKQKTKKKKRK